MFIIYDLIFLIVAILYLPRYLLQRKFQFGFLARLGFLPHNLELDRPIWIHAVSIGEVMSVRGLLEELRRTYTGKKFVISTVTATGNSIARDIARSGDFVTYLPLDLSFIVRGVIDRINPSLFIIAETELWPNFISCLYRKRVPIVTVNGRISDGSFKGYSVIKFLLKGIIEKINIFCVQSERDRERFKALGVRTEEIAVTGNMKFDINDYTDFKKDYTDNKIKLDLKPEEKLWVAASTHPGEEEIVLNVYKKLLSDFPDLRLLLAPRHPERSDDIGRIASRLGLRSLFLSDSPVACSTCIPKSVFILDLIGQLLHFYSIADIVFVGGSLVKKGGHNILEPASLSKPILFGPYMFNFRDIADLFLSNKAAILVNSGEELKTRIAHLLNEPKEALELARRGFDLIQENQGATVRNAEYIRKYVK